MHHNPNSTPEALYTIRRAERSVAKTKRCVYTSRRCGYGYHKVTTKSYNKALRRLGQQMCRAEEDGSAESVYYAADPCEGASGYSTYANNEDWQPEIAPAESWREESYAALWQAFDDDEDYLAERYVDWQDQLDYQAFSA